MNIANKFVRFLGTMFAKKPPKSTFAPPKVEKEHWDTHYDPNVVSYDKFRARRRMQESNKRVAEVEEKKEEDKETGHNPWLD